MKRKCLITLLCLTVVLAAGLPALATGWTPYYTLSTPSTPPGGDGWAEIALGSRGHIFHAGLYGLCL